MPVERPCSPLRACEAGETVCGVGDAAEDGEEGEDAEEGCEPGVFERPLVEREEGDGEERDEGLYNIVFLFSI